MYENQNDNYSNVYQTSESVPEMRLNPQMVPEKTKKSSGARKYFKKLLASLSFGLCFGLFTGLGFYAVSESTGLFANSGSINEDQVRELVAEAVAGIDVTEAVQGEETPSGISVTQNVTAVTTDVSDMVEEVMPAMVSIQNDFVESVSYFGQEMQKEGRSSGSGIIVGENDTELLVATNYHVIDGNKELTVNFIDGSNAKAVVKGSNADMDLAVIAVPLDSLTEETRNAIAVARLGDSDSLKLGEPVVAIGNALGIGQSVSGGFVSALNREITMKDGSTGTFIQTDAAINQGNSGGALLNIKGEVIGINSSKIGGELVEGMGFAIPISAAHPILEEMMLRETRTLVAEKDRGYIGIRLQTVTEEDSQMYGMPVGIYVYEVLENLAAKEAGVLKGDIITSFDGNTIRSNEDLQNLLQYYRKGETVDIIVMRNQNGDYQEVTLSLTLGEKPTSN